MKLALFLTLLRVFISPLFLVVYLYHQELGISLIGMPYYLLGLLVICELTDIFDGFVARRCHGVTDLGKILDPMADSIVRSSMMLTFTQGVVKLPLLLVLVFIYRDSIISTLRTLCALKGVALAARQSGKIKAVLQAVVIFMIVLLIIPYSMGKLELETFRAVSFYSVLIAAIYTLCSGVEYLIINRDAIKQSWMKT